MNFLYRIFSFIHEILLTPAVVAVIAVIIGWLLNEIAKRWDEKRKKRQERYELIIISLAGYLEKFGTDGEVKDHTILNLASLYCSDVILRKCFEFFTYADKSNVSNSKLKMRECLADIILELRRSSYCKFTCLAKGIIERHLKTLG